MSKVPPVEGTKLKILETAGSLFAQRGYEAATVREICRDAGVNQAAINYHFGDKERLYQEAVRWAQQRLLKQSALHMGQSAIPGGEPQADPSGRALVTPASEAAELRLHQFVASMLFRMLSPQAGGWERQLLQREFLEPTAACRQLVEEYFRPQVEALIGILQACSTQRLSLVEWQRRAFSVIGQCLYYRVAGTFVSQLVGPAFETEFSLEALARHITYASLAMVRGAPPVVPLCGQAEGAEATNPSSATATVQSADGTPAESTASFVVDSYIR